VCDLDANRIADGVKIVEKAYTDRGVKPPQVRTFDNYRELIGRKDLNHLKLLLEENPDQGFLVNVVGSLHVFQAARQVGTEKVVFLSSHAAMNPSSVMGATKRIGELMVRSLGNERTSFAAIRLANVIDSRGGVMSTFWRQIQRGGPVSVTHPEVAPFRQCMKSPISSLRGGPRRDGNVRAGRRREIKIATWLTHDQVERAGAGQGHGDCLWGLRPGEKLKDDLLGEGEKLAPTSHGRVFLADGPGTVAEEELVRRIAETEMHLARGPEALAAELHKLARIDLPTGRATPTTSNSPS
jgi:hypothetical protein